MRIVEISKKRNKSLKDIQVGFIALNKKGESGSYCVQGGFRYAVHDASGNRMETPQFYLK
jgi:N4-(beta-N-acetylglucosaminyl)-L-asparaginase